MPPMRAWKEAEILALRAGLERVRWLAAGRSDLIGLELVVQLIPVQESDAS